MWNCNFLELVNLLSQIQIALTRVIIFNLHYLYKLQTKLYYSDKKTNIFLSYIKYNLDRINDKKYKYIF